MVISVSAAISIPILQSATMTLAIHHRKFIIRLDYLSGKKKIYIYIYISIGKSGVLILRGSRRLETQLNAAGLTGAL